MLDLVMHAGWLGDLTAWLLQALHALLAALVDVLEDFVLVVLKNTLTVWLYVIDSIPVPDWISQYSLGTILGAAGPQIGWIMGTFKVAEGLALLGAGFAFRLVRKLLTLGQW